MSGLSERIEATVSGNASSYRDDSDLLTDKHRYVAVASDYLDPEETYVSTVTGAEEIGCDFCYEIDIVLDKTFSDFTRSVGQPATLAIKTFDKRTRYYNGVVEEITYMGLLDHRRTQYRLKLVSWLALLKYRKNCRIFQDKTSVEIVREIFRDHSASIADFSGVVGRLPKREFCIQFNESDHDFVSRLLEQDGIWYYFEHSKTHHKMILRNSGNANDCSPSEIETNQNASDVGPLREDNFSDWYETARLTSTQVRLRDYNHMHSGAAMEASELVPEVRTGGYATIDPIRAVSLGDLACSVATPVTPDTTHSGPHRSERQHYEFPGRYSAHSDGEFYAKIMAEREASRAYRVRIEGSARQLHTGDTFRAQNPFAITNFDLQPKATTRWRAVRVEMQLRGEEHLGNSGAEFRPFFYKCSVEAVTAETPFRPKLRTARPYIRGPQTAVVMGEPETVHVDSSGSEGQLDRVKVKFFWDLERRPKFESSCWIRVAQSMAGAGFGGVVLPRDGHEVVVQFIDGNPDWPIITGSVYNDKKCPPELLRPGSARSIFRTQTVGGSSLDYNEVRFDDTRGDEEVYLRAQHDLNVEVRHDHDLDVRRRMAVHVGTQCDIGALQRFSVSVAPNAAIRGDPSPKSETTLGSFLEVGNGRIALFVGPPGERSGLVITPAGVQIFGPTVTVLGQASITLATLPAALIGSQPALTPAPPQTLPAEYAAIQTVPPIT